jgi:uncharacterized protein (TIRG00374 family)
MSQNIDVAVAPRRRLLPILLSLFVGLLFLGIWLYLVGPRQVLSTLQAVAPRPAFLATLAWILAVFMRSYKWHVILGAIQAMPLATTGRVYWASSFLNMVFPFRVGELARSLFLKRLVGAPVAATLPSVLVDRLYSMAVMLMGLLFLPLTSFGAGSAEKGSAQSGVGLNLYTLRWGLGILAGALLVALISIYLLRKQKPILLRLVESLTRFLPSAWQKRVLAFLGTLIDGMGVIRSNPLAILGLLAWSAAVLGADALKDQLVFRALDLHVPWITCLMAVCLTNLAFILPSPPGNIGSNEWYATLVYATGFGLDPVRVAGGALFGHVMTALVVAAGGALSLSTLGLNLAEGLRLAQAPPVPAPEES